MLTDHKSVSLEGEAMKKYISFAIGVLLLVGGITLSDQVLAKHGYGSHGGQGMHHGSMRGKHWKSSLTDQQRSQINKLRLNYKKKKWPCMKIHDLLADDEVFENRKNALFSFKLI